MNLNLPKPKPLFELDENLYIKTVLIKNALYWVMGRNKQDRLILYSILTRLVLFFQKPVAIIIYDGEDLEKSVFRSLDSKYMFGDRELSCVFENYLNSNYLEDIYGGGSRLKNNKFKIFGTKYYIVFFIITYDPHGEIKNTGFKPINRNDGFGVGLKEILEDQEEQVLGLQEFINIGDVLHDLNGEYRSPSEVFGDRLYGELQKFPWAKEQGFEVIEPLLRESNLENKKYIDGVVDSIRKNLISGVFSNIDKTPFSCDGYSEVKNYFVFLKTATDSRDINSGCDKDGQERYKINYTIRLILCKKQRDKIREHYASILSKRIKCSWFDSENELCRIRGDENKKNIGKCIFFNESQPLVEDVEEFVEEFIANIEKPFISERSFLDSSLGSGILGVADVPDFSRSRFLGGGTEQPFKLWSTDKNPISSRHASTLCLAYQCVKYSDGIRPKAIVAPLVINGVTSMAVVTMSADNSGNDAKEWMMTYSRYLAVFSRMMTYPVRTKMKESYLNELRKNVSEALFNSFEINHNDLDNSSFLFEKFIYTLNVLCDYLCHIYPMQLVKFSFRKKDFGESCNSPIFIEIVDSNGCNKYNLLYYCLFENKRFDRLFEFNYIKPEQVEVAIKDGINDGSYLVLSVISKVGEVSQ